ncbi:MAG: hypothetical protein GX410_08415, partial [Elusimicrobia bacterium]|nr:hypothetical protein [Elusimicrobiota bacterium]
MSENKDPKLAQEEEDKKKKAATWLPGSSTVNRGKFGTMLSRGGPLGRILASKAGVLGLALGVTALASLAGVMIAKQSPADMPMRTAAKAPSRAAKYYTPSGARDSNRSSLSLIAGNQDYGQEVAKASAEPEEAVEEALPETPAMPELPSVAKGRKFSSSGLGGSGGGGGGSGAVMGNKSSAKPSQDSPASSSVLSDAFNSAKLGSGVRGTGMSRNPERAASGKTGSRQAVSTQQMQAAATPAGAELAGALEKKKAKSGEVFGEGVAPAAGSTKAASGGGLSDSYKADMPEASDDSSSGASSGGGGGGGGSGSADESASAACDEAESQMERALGVLQTSI